MPGYYTVKQGDYLSSIAAVNGFSDYLTIWNDPNNADLKSQRENPNVLFPGDQLFIPDLTQRTESRSTDQRHQFTLRKPDLKLRLVVEDLYEKPIANAQCQLIIEGKTRNVVTDDLGKIEEDIPPTAHNALLVISDPQTPFRDVQIPIKIGSLDPVDELSGMKIRLNNLGYFAGDPATAEDDQFRSAVEEFQCDHGLVVDGKCGKNTQAKLKQVHGC